MNLFTMTKTELTEMGTPEAMVELQRRIDKKVAKKVVTLPNIDNGIDFIDAMRDMMKNRTDLGNLTIETFLVEIGESVSGLFE